MGLEVELNKQGWLLKKVVAVQSWGIGYTVRDEA